MLNANILNITDTDLYKPPHIDHPAQTNKDTEITLDDMHGNALKFIYFLMVYGVFHMEDATYTALKELYVKKLNDYTSADISSIDTLLDQVKVRPIGLVRLIGDETCDRGSHDYFTLKIFEKLNLENIAVEIILSNHGLGFIEAYETQPEFKPTFFLKHHSLSMIGLEDLIQKNLIKRKDVHELIQLYYKPALKIISYSLTNNDNNSLSDETHLLIYTHAGVGLDEVNLLAQKFKVSYKDSTTLELASTIDQINEAFYTYVNANTVHTLYTRKAMDLGYAPRSELIPENGIIEFFVWNRKYKNLKRPLLHQNYFLHFCHGHDSGERSSNNIYVLNSIFGYDSDCTTEAFTSLFFQRDAILEPQDKPNRNSIQCRKERHLLMDINEKIQRLRETVDIFKHQIAALKQDENKPNTADLLDLENTIQSTLLKAHSAYSTFHNRTRLFSYNFHESNKTLALNIAAEINALKNEFVQHRLQLIRLIFKPKTINC